MQVPEAATRALRKFVIVLHEPLVLGFQWLLIGLKLLNLQLKEIATEHHNSDQQDNHYRVFNMSSQHYLTSHKGVLEKLEHFSA
jgi:xanthine/uracil permease